MALFAVHVNGVRAETERFRSESSGQASLKTILQNKQRLLQSQLSLIKTPTQLQSRLISVPPSSNPNALTKSMRLDSSDVSIIAEVARISAEESPASLAQRCKEYAGFGVDAIAVRTDEETSPDGIADLVAVTDALQVPVVRADWILHPLQVAETREAGGAALTAVYAVLQNGLPGIHSYATSLGLDLIVEILNLKELEAVSKLGILVYGINLSIKLSVSISGFRQDVAKSLLKALPEGVLSVVGITSVDEAVEMKMAGATALYVRHEVWQGSGELKGEAFIRGLRTRLS